MSHSSSTPEPTGPHAAGGSVSRLGRVFVQPADVFRELGARPTWLAALVAMVLITFATQLVVVPRIDFERTIRQAIEQRGGQTQLNDQQLNRQIDVARKIARVSMFASPLVVPIVFLLIAGVYYLGLRAMGSETEYKPIFSTVLHAAFPPSLVASAVAIVVVLQRSGFSAEEARSLVKSSVGAWLPASTPATVKAAAGVLDVFNAWQWILLVLGFEIVARVSRNKAILVVAVVWVVWALLKVGGAALQTAF
jgi:hypothetical protein